MSGRESFKNRLTRLFVGEPFVPIDFTKREWSHDISDALTYTEIACTNTNLQRLRYTPQQIEHILSGFDRFSQEAQKQARGRQIINSSWPVIIDTSSNTFLLGASGYKPEDHLDYYLAGTNISGLVDAKKRDPDDVDLLIAFLPWKGGQTEPISDLHELEKRLPLRRGLVGKGYTGISWTDDRYKNTFKVRYPFLTNEWIKLTGKEKVDIWGQVYDSKVSNRRTNESLSGKFSFG